MCELGSIRKSEQQLFSFFDCRDVKMKVWHENLGAHFKHCMLTLRTLCSPTTHTAEKYSPAFFRFRDDRPKLYAEPTSTLELGPFPLNTVGVGPLGVKGHRFRRLSGHRAHAPPEQWQVTEIEGYCVRIQIILPPWVQNWRHTTSVRSPDSDLHDCTSVQNPVALLRGFFWLDWRQDLSSAVLN